MTEEKASSQVAGAKASNVTSDWLRLRPDVQRVTYGLTLSLRDDVFQFGRLARVEEEPTKRRT